MFNNTQDYGDDAVFYNDVGIRFIRNQQRRIDLSSQNPNPPTKLSEITTLLETKKGTLKLIDLSKAKVTFEEMKEIVYALRSVHMPQLKWVELPTEMIADPNDDPTVTAAKQKAFERIRNNATKSLLARKHLQNKINRRIGKTIKKPGKERVQTSDDKENMVVVGLGPVGLAATLAAIQAHDGKTPLKIIGLYDRTEYTRGQILRIDAAQLAYLKSLLGRRVINHLKNHHQLEKQKLNGQSFWIIKTKTIEKILRMAVEAAAQRRPDLLELVQVKKASNEVGAEQTSFEFTEDGEHLELNLVDSEVPREVKLAHLVVADGAQSSADNAIAKTAKRYSEKFGLALEPTEPVMVEHKKHVAVQFRLPDGEEKRLRKLLKKRRLKRPRDGYIEDIRELGWPNDNNVFPEIRIFTSKNTLYINVEVPSGASAEFDYEEWARTNLKFYFKDRQDIKDLLQIVQPKVWDGKTEKGKAQSEQAVSSFEVEVRVLPEMAVPDSQDEGKAKFNTYFLGDTSFKIHPLTGFGMQTGLRQVKALACTIFRPLFKGVLVEGHVQTFARRSEKIIRGSLRRVHSYLGQRWEKGLIASTYGYFTDAAFPKLLNTDLFTNRHLNSKRNKKVLSHYLLTHGGNAQAVKQISRSNMRWLLHHKKDLLKLVQEKITQTQDINKKCKIIKDIANGNNLMGYLLFKSRNLGLSRSSGSLRKIKAAKHLDRHGFFSRENKGLTKTGETFRTFVSNNFQNELETINKQMRA